MAQTPDSKTILVLGGSFSGVSTAHYLLKHVIPKLPGATSYQVIMVSTSSQAFCRPACPRALLSDDLFPQDKLFVDIPRQFEQYSSSSFRFIHGTATTLNHVRRTVTVALAAIDNKALRSDEEINYYALIIATGASSPSPLLGLNNSSSDTLRSSWSAFRTALPTASSIIIAGGGPSGVETAGELGEYLNGPPPSRFLFPRKSKAQPKVSVKVITSSSQILPVLPPSVAAKAESQLSRLGVTVLKNARVEGVEPPNVGTDAALTGHAKVTLSDGQTLEADLYIPATGTKPNTEFIDAKELLLADGRVETDVQTLRVAKAGPRVYAVGDCASYARPAIPLITAAIPVLAANVKRDLISAEAGVGSDRMFKEDKSVTHLVPIGRSRGVGVIKGLRIPSWLVWVIKGRDYFLGKMGKMWSGDQWAKEK